MRRAAKRDANERPIVDALRAIGCSVIYCQHPDLIVGFRGRTFLMEIKNPDGKNALTDSQKELRDTWQGGPLHFVRDVDQALSIVTIPEG